MNIRYTPHPNTSRETEVECLANVYAFLLKRHENRKATETTGYEGEKAAEQVRAVETMPEKCKS